MAKCDGGYFCCYCGEYVESITESELYLRYVLREVPREELLGRPDGHIRCNGNLAQYIVDDRFPEVRPDEPALCKENRDPEWVRREEQRVTRGYRHLQGLPGSGIPMDRYPLAPLPFEEDAAPPRETREEPRERPEPESPRERGPGPAGPGESGSLWV